MPRRVLAAANIWSAWTALAVFFSISTSLTYVSQGRPPQWGRVLLLSLSEWWIWALLTPILVRTARAWPVSGARAWLHAMLHLACAFAAAFVTTTTDNWALRLIFHARPYLLINNLALQLLIYSAIVSVVVAVDRYGRNQAHAARLQADLGAAQLQLLRAQLRPHYLFNALNAISELVHEDPVAADQMIGRLSELLRATLRTDERTVVRLSDEIALVEAYLAIQQTRFGDRLLIDWSIPDDCRSFEVPQLLLQPLVENAIQHGLAPLERPGLVRLHVSSDRQRLRIAISDDGIGLQPVWHDGIGLRNTRDRLSAMYNTAATLTIEPNRPTGTTVTVTLPATRTDGATP